MDMAEYHLERLTEANAKRWDDFNAASPEGDFFHSLRWKPIAEAQNRSPRHDFLLFKNDAVVGLFPCLEHTIQRFSGLVPASYPMTLHAILEDYRDPVALQCAIEELKRLNGGSKKISFVCPATVRQEAFDAITAYPLYPYPFSPGDVEGDMVLDLSRSPPEKLWDSFTARSGQRTKIRQFEKSGFEIREVRTEDDLHLFYRYYAENMKYIGGSLPPLSFFAGLLETMPDEVRITLLSKGPLVAGGTLNILDRPRRRVHGIYLSLNRDLPNKYSPSYYIYWDSLVWAWENHYEKVTFGREYAKDLNDSNPRYRIKRDFGAEFEPVHSRMVPLSRIFAMGVRYKHYQARRQAADTPGQVA
jgi:hypothetical protein